MTFAFPWAFVALISLPLLLWYRLRRERRRPGLPYSDLHTLQGAPVSWRQRLRQLPLLLELLALALIIVGLARPQQGIEKTLQINHGIAIEMVVDRSSSMAEEFNFQGRRLNRLQAVKAAFHDFVQGTDELAGRSSDLIGLIAFARYPETICPLTLAHGALQGFLDQLQLVDVREEDGTAIGDGLALAVARLQKADERLAEEDSYQIKSKVIILLTDGRHNHGMTTPQQAAQQALEAGITIYAIGIGEPPGRGGFFDRLRGPAIDIRGMTALAEATGGKFWLASNGKALAAIYGEIDQLEKSEIQAHHYMDYKEYFSRFIIAALLALLLASLGRWFLWREV